MKTKDSRNKFWFWAIVCNLWNQSGNKEDFEAQKIATSLHFGFYYFMSQVSSGLHHKTWGHNHTLNMLGTNKNAIPSLFQRESERRRRNIMFRFTNHKINNSLSIRFITNHKKILSLSYSCVMKLYPTIGNWIAWYGPLLISFLILRCEYLKMNIHTKDANS